MKGLRVLNTVFVSSIYMPYYGVIRLIRDASLSVVNLRVTGGAAV